MESLWCAIGAALSLVLLAIAVLTVRPPRVRDMHPAGVLRGCVALGLLLVAATLLGLFFLARAQ